ncbi:MAG: protein tyrosine phosphatase [Candidatus Sericytochromatia bacterium]|nr:protein tyrosine phosphatase [Candidatus Sericytochromatia bacterium]
MNLLFVCSKNKWRSPTAEKIYQNRPFVQVKSAGTSKQAKRKLSNSDIQWADIIFVMESKHKERILSEFRNLIRNKTIYILKIPDKFGYMDQTLIEKIKAAVDPILASVLNRPPQE